MKECRVIVIDEESEELMKNELIDEDLADQIIGIIEDGVVDSECEGCETICSAVTEMLEEAGIKTEDHEEMLEALESLKFVKKENGNGDKKLKKIVKKVK